ncbi:kinetochore-associated protein [Trichophyton mentagrophytes]|nr:MIND kinetochore complex component Nnf1 [Trichophyton interdigitale]KAG5218726.1 MIND kinetochore complex component Nnf1 [Trichophyton interdigitale]KAG8207054.1 MIND kinetochore complex component Nnf1 [Trichophyton interdigitale]GBF62794.1 kinetochore-associated protein [Trichophyton mentagrophytes]
MAAPTSNSDPTSTAQQTEPQEPSPSPPPAAPVPLTPGPRASRLQQVFSQALLHTIRTNSYANFSACFPTPAKHVPRSLESVWRQLNAKLEESARAEFDDILHERGVVRGLNELDRLVGEAKLRRENGEGASSVPAHTLTANELYQAHLAPVLAKAQSSLETQTEEVQKKNTELASRIESQRQEIQQLLASLEAVVGDIQGAVKSMDEFDEDNILRKEAEQIDEEIRSSQPL